MLIDEVNLPAQVIELLKKNGLDELYPPQTHSLNAGVLDGKNIVLASPTASGKTLVSEMCILKHILEKEGKALYLTPLRALANEKYEEFKKYSNIIKSNGKRISIAISTGDYDSSDTWLDKNDIILTTNEKSDSLLRHKAKWLDSITVVIADEIHLITEPRRGPTLEIVLARLKQINPHIQFIALSATVENAEEVATWLNAIPITTEWRPVPLKEGIYCQGELMFKDGSSRRINQETDHPSINVALESINNGGQALIFNETRRSTVEMSRRVANVLKNILKSHQAQKRVADKILAAHEKTTLSKTLSDHIQNGAGFHHAGLSSEHRRLVENAFKNGTIKILSATPTLAAGVNLPARTVIINSYERYEPGYGRYPISVLEYKQICGRAGRPKYDRSGEAVLIAKTFDEQNLLMEKYVFSNPEKLWSKLAVEKVLRPHVLSTIAMGFAHSEKGLFDFFSHTFCAYQYGGSIIHTKLTGILKFLYEEDMINIEGHHLLATKFGKRVSELYIDPESAVIIRNRLQEGVNNISELTFLHLAASTPDLAPKMHPRKKEIDDLSVFAEEHRLNFFCDIPDMFSDLYDYEDFLAEVKTSKILLDWINELPEEMIFKKYGVEPGDLLRLVDLTDWLLYAIEELTYLFGKKEYRSHLKKLRIRIKAGIKEELIPLVQLKGIGRVRARALHKAGFCSLADLRKARISQLMGVPTIGPEITQRIKEQVGGTISKEEWEMLRKGQRTEEQKLISEYQKV